MMHDVYLYGGLAEKYGAHHQFDIQNAPEAARALAANYKGFRSDISQGYYRVVIGDLENGTELDESELNFQIGKNKPLHIVPVAAGAKKGGAGKIIAGVALVALAVAFAPAVVGAAGPTLGMGATAFTAPLIGGVTWGNIAMFGVSLAFQGASALLTPTPKVADYGARETPDQRASFIFNGPLNRSAEGSAVPIAYGECEIGSLVAQAGIEVEKLL